VKSLLKTAILSIFLGALPCKAWALPSLQLYFDPTIPFNTNATYNTTNQGWETDGNPVVLSTFMQGLNLSDTFRVIISLPNQPSSSNPNGIIDLPIVSEYVTTEGSLGSPGAWIFGNPGLPPHGVFDTWHTSYDFTFTSGNAATIFDVQTGGSFQPGFRDDFLIAFGSGAEDDVPYHFDLVDVTAGTVDGHFKEFAPFSHDAQRVQIIPEPSTVVLLGLGIIGFVVFWRRRWKTARPT